MAESTTGLAPTLLEPNGETRPRRAGSDQSQQSGEDRPPSSGSTSPPSHRPGLSPSTSSSGSGLASRWRSTSSPKLPGSPLRQSISALDDSAAQKDDLGEEPMSQHTLNGKLPKLPAWQNEPRQHRHLDALNKAFAQLVSFVPDHDSPSIRTELEEGGWHYAGSRQGVHIYSREPAKEDIVKRPELGYPSASFEKGKAGETQQPLSASGGTALPYFRGEGWLPGSWRASDVAATFASIPARATIDTRLDPTKSFTVQVLDEHCGDSLSHLSIRAQFPVGARDQCIASAYREQAEDKPCSAYDRGKRGWYVFTSVDDPLVPEVEGTQRSWTYLSGLSIVPMERPPLYDLPNEFEEPAPIPGISDAPFGSRHFGNPAKPDHVPATMMPTTPKPRYESLGHTIQTLSGPSFLTSPSPAPRVGWSEWDWTTGGGHSNVRMTHTNGASGTGGRRQANLTNNGVPRPQTHLIGSKRNQAEATPGGISGLARAPSLSKLGTGMSSSVLPTLASASHSPYSSPPDEHRDESVPGCHVSYVIRIDPRGQLPVTFVNQLSLTMPLVIHNVRRYMAKNGFVPHLCRMTSTPGVHVVGEEFDPSACTYKIQFRVSEQGAGGATRVRFHGSTFGRGQFEVSIMRASDWTIEYDNKPLNDEAVGAMEEPVFKATKLPPDPKAKRTSIRMTPVSLKSAGGSQDLTAAALGHIRRSTSLASDEMTSASSDTNAASPTRSPPPPKVSLTLQPFEKDIDPAALPGPRGGCTLVISNTVIGPTIQATITKSSEKPALPAFGGSLRRAMETVGKIAADSSAVGRERRSRAASLDTEGFDTVGGGSMHRRSLEAARQTMEQVMRLREQEGLPPGLFDHPSAGSSKPPSRSGSFSGRSRSGTAASRAGGGPRTPSRRGSDGPKPSAHVDGFAPALATALNNVSSTSPTSYESGSPLAMKPLTKAKT